MQGSATVPYDVTVELQTAGSGPRFSSYCDCPVEYNCKHGAAAVIAFLDMRAPDEILPPRGEDDTVDGAIFGWLRQLEAYRALPAAPQDEDVRYLLDVAGSPPRMKLTARAASMLKNGERSLGRAIAVESLNSAGGSYIRADRSYDRAARGGRGNYRSVRPGVTRRECLAAIAGDAVCGDRSNRAVALAVHQIAGARASRSRGAETGMVFGCPRSSVSRRCRKSSGASVG